MDGIAQYWPCLIDLLPNEAVNVGVGDILGNKRMTFSIGILSYDTILLYSWLPSIGQHPIQPNSLLEGAMAGLKLMTGSFEQTQQSV